MVVTLSCRCLWVISLQKLQVSDTPLQSPDWIMGYSQVDLTENYLKKRDTELKSHWHQGLQGDKRLTGTWIRSFV